MRLSCSPLESSLSVLVASMLLCSDTTLLVPSTRSASIFAWMSAKRSSIGLRSLASSSAVRTVPFLGMFPIPLVYRYFALRRSSSSWLVSLVSTMPERCPLDMTPIRFVMPRISGISEETTITVVPRLAMAMMSS